MSVWARRPMWSFAVLHSHLSVPLYRNGYALIAGYGATSALGLVFWAVAARSADANAVGIAAAVSSLVLLTSGVSQMGLNTALLRFVPIAGRGTATTLVLSCYAATATSAFVLGFVACRAVPHWSSELSFLAERPSWTFGVPLACAGWSVFVMQDSALTAMRAAPWVLAENVAFSAVRVAVLVAVSATTAGVIFSAAVIPAVATIVPVSALMFGRIAQGLDANPVGEERLDRRDVVRFALPNYLGSLSFTVSAFAMPLVVTTVAGPGVNAYFYAAWSIGSGLQLVSVSMTSSLVVEGSRDIDRLAADAGRSLRLLGCIVVPAALIVALAAPQILSLFGPDYASNGSGVLRTLALAAVPNIIVTLSLAVARVRRSGSVVVLVQSGLMLGGLVLATVLLRWFGLTGIGVGWLVSQTVFAVAILPWLRRQLWPDDRNAARTR